MTMPGEAQRLIDNLATAVLLVDDDLRLQAINTAAEDMLSLSARLAMGQRLDRLLPDFPLLVGVVRRALSSGHSFTERDLKLIETDSLSLIVDCTATPLDAAGRDEVLVELINVDRHHRIVREETIMAQHNVSSALIRGMAHEIKNPLGGLRGAAQLLQRELTDESLKEYTRIIIQEADRLHKLVDRMLGPNKLPAKTRVNIHEVLEHVRSLVEADAPDTLQVVRDYDPSLPEIHADPDQLVQALLNIVRNAVQAIQAGGVVPGHITLRTRPQRMFTIGSQLHKLVMRIDVVDNGPGIPADIAEGIFFPMVSGRDGGTGLGLPIAQAMVHRQGGLIAYTSRPGSTVFSVWLPIETRA